MCELGTVLSVHVKTLAMLPVTRWNAYPHEMRGVHRFESGRATFWRVAQWQSTGLLIPVPQVRCLPRQHW